MDEWIDGRKNVKWIAGINGWIDELITNVV